MTTAGAPRPPWPGALGQALRRRLGAVREVEPLRGLGLNRTWRVGFTGGERIVKASRGAIEAGFYREVAPVLPPVARAAIPACDGVWPDRNPASDVRWLVLEFVPHPLSRERWLADPEALAVLAAIHGLARRKLGFTPFAPVWSAATDEAALGALPASVRRRVAARLGPLRAEAQPLFARRGSISGDPNPRNWGVRADGSLVLFDWERFGRGTPALDLAITVPGLGDAAAFARVARAADPGDPDLPRALAVAKAWSVVEFLALVSAGRVADTTAVPFLAARFPAWLDELR